MQDKLIVVRSGGDIGSAIAHKLYRSGFKVLIVEIPEPLAIRRRVSFSEAVFDETSVVEGVGCRKIDSLDYLDSSFEEGMIPLYIDSNGASIYQLKPECVVDAILAKRNTGTSMDMAPLTIGLGPGFFAGENVHVAIETNRGHNLGRIIYHGKTEDDTGVPGIIMGYGNERVLRAPVAGQVRVLHGIGDLVAMNEVVMTVGEAEVRARIAGVVRGCIRDGVHVPSYMKIGDVDPRGTIENCDTISDKARCIAGGVLEAVMFHLNGGKQ